PRAVGRLGLVETAQLPQHLAAAHEEERLAPLDGERPVVRRERLLEMPVQLGLVAEPVVAPRERVVEVDGALELALLVVPRAEEPAVEIVEARIVGPTIEQRAILDEEVARTARLEEQVLIFAVSLDEPLFDRDRAPERLERRVAIPAPPLGKALTER